MSPILVGYGTHTDAVAALHWAVLAAKVLEEPLEVVSVFEPSYAEVAPEWFDDLVTERRNEITAQAHEAGADDLKIHTLAGDPIRVFAEYVEGHEEALVVVGACSHSGPGELGSGSPAHALLHHLSSPLAVIRDGFEPIGGGVIVVGVDGSGANAMALRWAETTALATGARLIAVFAYDPIDDTFTHPEGWHRHSDEVRAQVGKVTSVPVELVMEAGHPTEILIDVSRREHAAAIVVGTRGRGGFPILRTGRVPTQLIDHATVPVVVVPHAERT